MRISRTVLRSMLIVLLALGLSLTSCDEQPTVAPSPAQTQPPPPSSQLSSPPSATNSVSGFLTVRFVDVGQGDAILICLPEGVSMLIDAGPKDVGKKVVSTIEDLSVNKLDYLVFTHPHEDHIGGAAEVITAFDIGQVLMPLTSHTTGAYEDLVRAIEAKGLSITEARAGRVVIDRENLRVWFIGPNKTWEDPDDMSAVLALRYGERTLLFEGDASGRAEAELTLSSPAQLGKVDVLKVANHGSAASSTKTFLELISPDYAVISVGSNNYGYPAKETLDRLAAVGAKILRTDQVGTVTVTTDGKALSVVSERQVAEMMKRLNEASPQQVVEIYYEALGKQVWEVALAARTEERLQKYGRDNLLRGMTPVTKVSDVKVTLDKTLSQDSIEYSVSFYQESNWEQLGNGRLVRFVTVVRNPATGQWRIDSIATGP